MAETVTAPIDPETFDFMVLVSFDAKREWEGSFSYTFENWPPVFRDERLRPLGTNEAGFRAVLNFHRGAIAQWWKDHRGDGVDLINTHRDAEATQNFRWGVRLATGKVCPVRSHSEALTALQHQVHPGSVLVHRENPDAEWAGVRCYVAHIGHPAAKWVADQFGPMMASTGHEISHDGAGTLSLDEYTLGFLRLNPPDADGYVSEIDAQMHIWYGGAPYPLACHLELLRG